MQTKKRDNYLTWDEYFMAITELSAMRSKDPSTVLSVMTTASYPLAIMEPLTVLMMINFRGIVKAKI